MEMRQPAITTFMEVVIICENAACERTMPLHSKMRFDKPAPTVGLRGRLRAAWMVFTGEADALVWPNKDYA